MVRALMRLRGAYDYSPEIPRRGAQAPLIPTLATPSRASRNHPQIKRVAGPRFEPAVTRHSPESPPRRWPLALAGLSAQEAYTGQKIEIFPFGVSL